MGSWFLISLVGTLRGFVKTECCIRNVLQLVFRGDRYAWFPQLTARPFAEFDTSLYSVYRLASFLLQDTF